MSDGIPPTAAALGEALDLSNVVLRNIELSELPLGNVALKACRLARLLNDFEFERVMQYESAGYPLTHQGFAPEIWELLKIADRVFEEKDDKSDRVEHYAYSESIQDLETQLESAKIALAQAHDPDMSISSANPHQWIYPVRNQAERNTLQIRITKLSKRLASRKTFLHQYASQKHIELKYASVAGDVFSRIREKVDSSIGYLVPTAVQKFISVYDNLRSTNPEDWSNAVHSCRRILQDLADAVFPPSSETRPKQIADKKTEIKLGPENYINRLVCFVEDNCESERFEELVGSHLHFLGDRLDSIFRAAQKGSHATIPREEADRYVVYTYMIVGDILSLWESVTNIKSN